jgi:2-furoate---CoA ligase
MSRRTLGCGERTLGVMPLYHTMGVRSLLRCRSSAARLCVCPGSRRARPSIDRGEKITNLYLVPTLYHDLLHHPAFKATDVSSVRKLGFAGAPMTDALLRDLRTRSNPICSSITTARPRSTLSP